MPKHTLIDLHNTTRLHLRAPQSEDLDALVTLWTDPEVTTHIGGPRDAGLIRREFGRYVTDPAGFAEAEREWWWMAIERSSGAPAGLCGLIEKEVEGQTEVELVYFFMPAFWGQGYATEAAGCVAEFAFSDLDLESLVAVIDPRNAPSAGVARRLGMHIERESLRGDGVTRQIFRLRRPAGPMNRAPAKATDDITYRRGRYTISTDRDRLDLNVIQRWLNEESYWAQSRPRAIMEKAIAHSLCFGVYEEDQQVGFARVVTDGATFAWLCDVFILESHRDLGLGKWLIESVVAHPELRQLQLFLLATADAHELYRRYGDFESLQETHKWMRRKQSG